MKTISEEDARYLEEVRAQMQRCRSIAGLGAKSIGFPDRDQKLWRIGRELIGEGGVKDSANGPDVYLATQLYADGGHTALIGDFVRALDGEENSRLVLTNLENLNPAPLPEKIRTRLGISSDNISIIEGDSLAHRLASLIGKLRELRARRLFLFHHPDDPLACVVAQPEIASQRFMVHHTDFAPSLGLYLPGVELIDLNPGAASVSRILGLTSSWLPLCAPDPGPRSAGFLRRGKLVTASSGGAFKFTREYLYTYPETVAFILRQTGGWHVHVGPLDTQILAQENFPHDRFIHISWVPSLAHALWENEVDLYFASFPIDGARTKVEVLASATPYLGHSARKRSPSDGKMFWNTGEDLGEILHNVSNVKFLETQSRLSRAEYEQLHHPDKFAQTLSRILAGKGGREDSEAEARDLRTMKGLLSALTAAACQDDSRRD